MMRDTNSDLAPRMHALKIGTDSVQNLQDMESRTRQLNHDNGAPIVVRAPRQPSAPARLPPLPADALQCGRFYFFGWHITKKWLRSLAEENHFPPAGALYSCIDGLRYIAWKTQYKYSWPVMTKVEEGEHYENEYPRLPGDTELFTDVLMVWVNHKKYSHRRPTEAQMKILVEIFGKKGRWFKDGQRTRKFYNYEMDDDSPSMARNYF